MTEDRDKWRKYVHGVANSRIEDGWRTEQRTVISVRFRVRSSTSSTTLRGLSAGERCRSYKDTACTSVLCPIIGSCQTDVEWCKVGLDHQEPCVTWSAGWPAPVCSEWAKLAVRARVWSDHASTTTQHTFNGTTQVSRYQKDKTNLELLKQIDSEWQWHLLGHMQVCISLQPAPHHSVFHRPDALPVVQPTASKHRRHNTNAYKSKLHWTMTKHACVSLPKSFHLRAYSVQWARPHLPATATHWPVTFIDAN